MIFVLWKLTSYLCRLCEQFSIVLYTNMVQWKPPIGINRSIRKAGFFLIYLAYTCMFALIRLASQQFSCAYASACMVLVKMVVFMLARLLGLLDTEFIALLHFSHHTKEFTGFALN